MLLCYFYTFVVYIRILCITFLIFLWFKLIIYVSLIIQNIAVYGIPKLVYIFSKSYCKIVKVKVQIPVNLGFTNKA